jgi:hypothetical protein
MRSGMWGQVTSVSWAIGSPVRSRAIEDCTREVLIRFAWVDGRAFFTYGLSKRTGRSRTKRSDVCWDFVFIDIRMGLGIG